jgi:hypothetical protein
MTKWNERYPEWRDDPKVICFPFDPSSGVPGDAVLSLAVFNTSKTGRDELFARTLVPLRLVMDQLKHSFWLRLCCPSGKCGQFAISSHIYFKSMMLLLSDSKAQKFGRSRPKVPDNCALRIDLKLSYSKVLGVTPYMLILYWLIVTLLCFV